MDIIQDMGILDTRHIMDRNGEGMDIHMVVGMGIKVVAERTALVGGMVGVAEVMEGEVAAMVGGGAIE